MINRTNKTLIIFDSFQIDFKLPKWQDKSRYTDFGLGTSLPNLPRIRFRNAVGSFNVSSGALLAPTNREPDTAASTGHKISGPTLFEKIFQRKKLKRLALQEEFSRAITEPNFTVEPPPESTLPSITVEEFFASVKNSVEELADVKARYESYEKVMAHLRSTGQIALIEHMEHEVETIRAETQLYAIGFRKVITEENLVAFAEKAPHELHLTWIKNFMRSIPAKVLEAKLKCDERHIFDNYVILHYDKENTGIADTKEDIVKKKDPILFGVLAGSTKLYYLADWIDEYCDLTFDKLVETLGDKAITANDLTVNIKVE